MRRMKMKSLTWMLRLTMVVVVGIAHLIRRRHLNLGANCVRMGEEDRGCRGGTRVAAAVVGSFGVVGFSLLELLLQDAEAAVEGGRNELRGTKYASVRFIVEWGGRKKAYQYPNCIDTKWILTRA
jgi:hypothetical protein